MVIFVESYPKLPPSERRAAIGYCILDPYITGMINVGDSADILACHVVTAQGSLTCRRRQIDGHKFPDPRPARLTF